MPGRRHPGAAARVRIRDRVLRRTGRSRTTPPLWAVTVPPTVLAVFALVLIWVLIPNPYGWFGVAGCSAGVLLVARLRLWLGPPMDMDTEREVSPMEAVPDPVPGAERPPTTPGGSTGEEEAPTSPLPP
ncbi:hypothetical protein ACIBCM_08550 [Streptomyces sp. NPDC051018]|uniref:hypothetical protein n=1 Tax=Streptomyces sp. NPDC051018 TaxID=3365639 RepID=UPI00378F785D